MENKRKNIYVCIFLYNFRDKYQIQQASLVEKRKT